jgi:protoporphyrinogen oxidase
MPAGDAEKLKEQDNVGVVCVVMKLEKALTENFWLNINDENMDIPGVIEISNLNIELSENIVYLPFYLHKNSVKYQDDDNKFKDKATKYVSLINENINASDIKDIKVFRCEYAQPVTGVNFRKTLPPMQSPERNGFYFADTAYSYPEDRSINESVKIAYELSNIVQGEK